MIRKNPMPDGRVVARAARAGKTILHVTARRAILLVVLSTGVVAGCGAARPVKYYQLTVPSDESRVLADDPGSVTLVVGSLLATHLYREDRIVYSGKGEQMGTYENHRWAEPPTEMVQELLRRSLRFSGHYRAVYSHRSSAKGDFLLRGRLYDFKEVSGKPILARVTLELELRDLKNSATVWTHYYTLDEPVTGKDVPAIAAALNRNVQQGVKEIVGSLDQYFASHPVK